jgi:glycosyltransferase involved in cell wall biosynthesis
LSPNKGIESMIDALPALIRDVPDVRYLVLGVTHPHLVRHEGGEHYRAGLMARAEQRGVSQHVEFRNDFLELDALCDWLQAADVYVTPYRDEAQITSGTLAYAHGLGKPIVSTPYWHASELLADSEAQIVPFGDAAALTRATAALLTDSDKRSLAARRAYQRGRGHVWSEAARSYHQIFRAALRSGAADKSAVHRPAMKMSGGSHAALAPFRALRHRLGGEAAEL